MTTNDDTAAALAASDTHDDEDMWVSPPFESSSPFQNNLRDFESLLRCTICRGILDKAVSLKACSHSFCSLCIRRSIRDAALQGNRKPPTCPVCKEEVDKNTKLSIMPNRSLQMLAAQFQTMRGDLRDRLLGVVSNDAEHNAGESTSSEPEGETAPRRSPRTLRASDDEEEHAQPPAGTLEAATAPTAVLSSQERLPPRASLPYGTMKKKKLQELCEKDGLSTKGDEAALKKRHLEFMLLYHAECDSFLPQRTPQELAREIMDQEKKKLQEQHAARMSGVATHGVLVKRIGDSTHKSDEESGTSSAASSGNVKFDSKWKEGFAILIGESLARNKMTTEDLQRKRKKWTDEDLDKSVVGFKPVFEDQKPAARASSRNSNVTQSTLASAFGFGSAPQQQTTATAPYEQKPPPFGCAPTAHHASTVAAWSGTAGESAARAPAVARFSLSQPPSQMSQSSNHLPTPTSARSRNPYIPAASASSSAFASQNSSAVSVDSTPSPHNPPSSAAAARPILDRGQQTLHASVPPLNPYAQSSGRKRKAPASTGPWTCSNCTFRNEKRNYANARCEMCEVSRNEHEQPDVPAEKQEEATSSNGEVAICIDC